MNKLHEWVFHYNSLTKNWEAITRDNYNDLFSDNTKALKSKDINTLIDLIVRTNGVPTQIDELLNNN